MNLRSNSVRGAAYAAGCAAAAACLVPLVVGGPADAAGVGSGTTTITGSTIKIGMRGNGHGHGMSQYGALGAAEAGLSARKIVAFYYQGTSIQTLPKTVIRVLISDTGGTLQVGAASGLYVTGVSGALPTSKVSRYRLMSDSASGETLQALPTTKGASWRTVARGLPDHAQFHRARWAATRLYFPDGSSTAYGGYLRAVRNSSSGNGGVYVVNQIGLDVYTAGVVPREMPASWSPAAVQAQALAARTYGRYAVEQPQSSQYDICDSSNCQVYGGAAGYSSSGALQYTDYWPAVTATSNQIITYRGAPIFAQFSASNGGWTVDGGQPYLQARADPYDSARGADPYSYDTQTMSDSSFASYFGLRKVTQIVVTKRDGHGDAGGRILAGYVRGTTSSGKTRTVQATGYDFQYASGTGTTWLTFRNG